MKIEIEVPPPPEGYRVDGYRFASRGDLFLNHRRAWQLWGLNHVSTILYIVAAQIQPLWVPSAELVAVLEPGWITRDMDGKAWWFDAKPYRDENQWLGSGEMFEIEPMIKKAYLPPMDIPWDECCFQIGEVS